MLFFSCIFILQLFATTVISYSILISKPEVKDRKVNLALETVLEFNNKDNAADIQFLDNIQKFIGKVRNVIDKNNDLRREFNSGKLEKFTDFIHNVIEIIYKFEDNDLESFFFIISDEIRKYHYRGCKFHELTGNYDLRKFIGTELDALKNIPAKTIRNKILAIAEKIEVEQYDKNERELVDLINSLYRQKSPEKFRKILLNIDDYRLNVKNNSIDLVKIIREGIRSIIFDHYTELNHNARTALKSKIEEYWMYPTDLSKTLVSQVNAQEIKLRSYNEDDSIKIDDDTKKHKNKPQKTGKSQSMREASETTITEKTDIYINLNKHIQVKYETPYSEQTTEGKKKVKKMTFMTLYPRFVFGPRSPMYRVADISPTLATIKNTLTLQQEHVTGTQISLKSNVYDSATEATFKKRHKKHSSYRKHKQKRTTRQVNVEDNLDLKFGSYTKDKFTNKRKRKRKLTFLTLYPEFDMETTATRNSRIIKKQLSSPSIRNAMQTLWYEKIKKPYHKIMRGGESRAILSTNKIFLELVTMKPYTPTKAEPTKKLKYEVNLKTDDVHRKQSELSMKKSQFGIGLAKLKYSEPGVNIWSQPSVEEYGQSPTDINNRNMKSTRKESIVLENRLELLDRTYRKSYGNSLTNIPKDGVLVDRHILTKIQDLEKELKNVKTQIINDTKTIKDLNSKVHKKVMYNRNNHKFTKKYHANEFNDDHKVNPIKEVVFDLAAQINLDNGLKDDFNLGETKNIVANVIKSKSYIRNFHNSDLNINKKTKYELDRTTYKDKKDNIKGLFQQDKENHKDSTQYGSKHPYSAKSKLNNRMESNQNNKIKQNDNDFHRDTFIRLNDNYHSNSYKNDHEKYIKPDHKKVGHTFELKSFVDDTVNAYSNKMSKNNYDLNRNTFNIDTRHNKNNELKSDSKVKEIGHNRDRSIINLFDETADGHKFINDQKYYKKSNDQQYVKKRFELKSFTDDMIGMHYNKMGEQKNKLEQTTFNIDRYRDLSHEHVNHLETNTNGKIKETQRNYDRSTINILDDNNSYQNNEEQESDKNTNQREIQHRFKITSFTVDKANILSKNTHDRQYDPDRNNIHEHKHDGNVGQMRDLTKYNKERKKYVDASENRKEQENKYYSNSNKNSVYELDEAKNTKNKERIYDSDLNKVKIITSPDQPNQNDDRIYEFNGDLDLDRKNIFKYEDFVSHANKTYPVNIYHDTNANSKRQTTDGTYDINDRKLLKSKEYESNVIKSQIQKDRNVDIQDSFKKEEKEIYNMMKSSSRKEKYNADNQVFQKNNKSLPNSYFSNERQIHNGGYLNMSAGDINSAINHDRNTFEIVSEHLGDPAKDIVRVYDPNPNTKPEYKKKYANEINKGLVTTHDLEKHVSLEGNENIRVFKKHNEIEYDLNGGGSKKNTYSKEKETNKDYSENILKLGTTHKQNEVVFKADRNTDMFNINKEQISKNTSIVPKTTKYPEILNITQLKKDLDGDSLNQYYHRAQQELHITENKLNKTSDGGTLPKDFDGHVHEYKFSDRKDNNFTTTLKYERNKGLLDIHSQKEKKAERMFAVQNIVIDPNANNGNKSFEDIEKEKSNTTSMAKNSTARLTALQTKATTVSLVHTANRKIFTNLLPTSISSTTDTLLTASTSRSPDLRKNNDDVLDELSPFEAANLDLRGYGDTQKAADPMALGLLRKYNEKENNNTVSPNDYGAVMNYTQQLYPDVFDFFEHYTSLKNNVAENIDIAKAPPPGFIIPPDYGPMI